MASQSATDAAEQVKLAAEAFLYGYPLVYNLHEMAAFVAGSPRFPVKAHYNEFGHARELAGPGMKFVSPNNDTCYSLAVCDVRSGPLVLHVPDTHDRYYVLQFVDAWTNNFAYIGRRATGTAEAHYLLAAHDYQGDVPAGMPVVRAPSSIFVIVGRLAVDGAADLPAVHALQDQFTLTPLSVYEGRRRCADRAACPSPMAACDLNSSGGSAFAWRWQHFRRPPPMRRFLPSANSAG